MTNKHKGNIKYQKVNGVVRAIKRNMKNKFDISQHAAYNSGEYFTPPIEDRKAILLSAHVFGHFGSKSIVKAIHNDGLHRPNLLTDAVEMVKSCIQCQKHNITKRGYNPLRPIYSYILGDDWSIDLAELPMSENGPLKDKRAATVAFELVKVFSDFGYPTKLGMDNGSEMKNMIIKVLCKSMHIDQRLITPYKASSNGTSERWVQSAKLAIAKSVEGAGHQWDLFTPNVQLALNNKVSKRISTPPFNLMFAQALDVSSSSWSRPFFNIRQLPGVDSLTLLRNGETKIRMTSLTCTRCSSIELEKQTKSSTKYRIHH
ncbi:hypothetical protein [Parasitella parasitica]|uniref:Integrase catalytic domain-containing protein n=1 Tax=Parasitella parasitica TaxID=35722 RepID=A0A0B7NBF5_9FUNG|nr:hypothetical protein [Parasitella parasitica]